MGVLGDFTVNGATQFNGGALVIGLLDVQGQISFLDNTSPGLILNNLTTTQRDALAVGGGEVVYNSSTNSMDFYNGSTWNAVALSGNFVSKAGDTMTGLLGFTGTTHAGLRLNILTTIQRNALTPGAADFLYDSTLSRPFYWNGFSWDSMVRTTGDSMTGDLAILSLSRGGSLVFSPAIADGSTPYALSTDVAHTSGYLAIFSNNGTPKFSVTYAGGLIADSGATLNGNLAQASGNYFLSPDVADGNTAFGFNTSITHTSGYLFLLANNGTPAFSVNSAGGIVAGSATLDQVTVDNLAVVQSTLAYAATTTIDFSGDGFKTVTLAGDVTFDTSNRAANRSVTVRIICDGTLRNFTFPSWIWVGDIPTSIAASKNAILTLTATGGAETDVIAAYAVQG